MHWLKTNNTFSIDPAFLYIYFIWRIFLNIDQTNNTVSDWKKKMEKEKGTLVNNSNHNNNNNV